MKKRKRNPALYNYIKLLRNDIKSEIIEKQIDELIYKQRVDALMRIIDYDMQELKMRVKQLESSK